jgi:uncharacterized iron-regulated protein
MISAPTSATLRGLTLCIVCCLGAIAAAASESQWHTWAQDAQKQHALAGRIYDMGQGKLHDPSEGPLRLPPAGIALLGEVHDNPAHHRLRGWLIADALRRQPDRRPAVVVEQIRTDQQPALDQFKALNEQQCCRLTTAVDLLQLLDWDKSGWPPAEMYRPLFDAVVAGGLPIVPANPPRDRVRAVARGGLDVLAGEERTRMGLDSALPAPLADALRHELEESHCGALPPQAMSGMAAAQRYLDAHMADALIAGAQSHGSAILIAGNGHVRADRGVPWHIRQRAPGTPVTAILLLEVEDGRTDPADYVPRDPEGRPAADFVIFTPRAKRGDPCEALRKKGSDPSPQR